MTQPNDNKNQASDVVEAVARAIEKAVLEFSDSGVKLTHSRQITDISAQAAIEAYESHLQAQLTAALKECERFKWQDISTAPRDGTPIATSHLVRYLPYKPDGQRQMKKHGRWQEWNGYGWSNIDWEPSEWRQALQPKPLIGEK